MQRFESGASKWKRTQEEREKVTKLPKLTQFLVQLMQPAVLETSSSPLSPQPSTSAATITLADSDVLRENSNMSNVTHCSLTEKHFRGDCEVIGGQSNRLFLGIQEYQVVPWHTRSHCLLGSRVKCTFTKVRQSQDCDKRELQVHYLSCLPTMPSYHA